MTAIEGVDFSLSGRPGGAALAAKGKHFVVRYVPYGGDGGKGLTRPEIPTIAPTSSTSASCSKSTAGRWKQGRDAGVLDAKTSEAAIDQLGMPRDLPVYFAVDRDVSKDDQPVIDAYLSGAASVMGAARIGIYGEYSLMRRCRRNGTAHWFWQTLAWSNGTLARFAHLHQYANGQEINGAAVDYTRAMRSPFGQWVAAASGAGPATPAPLKSIPPTRAQQEPTWTLQASGSIPARG